MEPGLQCVHVSECMQSGLQVCREIAVEDADNLNLAVYHDGNIKPDRPVAQCDIPLCKVQEAQAQSKDNTEPIKLSQHLDPRGIINVEIRLEENVANFHRVDQVEKMFLIRGHKFVMAYFAEPTTCTLCKEFLWGLLAKQGLKCRNCNMAIHRRCYESILADCPGVPRLDIDITTQEARIIKVDNAHNFVEDTFLVPEWCKCCGRLVNGLFNQALRCKTCNDVVHAKCKNNATATCGVDMALLAQTFAAVKTKPPPQKKVDFRPNERGKTIRRIMPSIGEKPSLEDFTLLKTLGRGAFGKVILARQKKTKEIFAIKAVEKAGIIEGDDVEITMTERNCLALGWSNRFITKLQCSFQTTERLFFVMEFLSGGDLMYHIIKVQLFLISFKFYYIWFRQRSFLRGGRSST